MRRRGSVRAAAGVAAVAGMLQFVTTAADAAATRVLAIGINDYDYEQQLSGAVADAEDIAETMRKAGAEVVLLRDREASRARIEQEWRGMVGRSASGDTIILSYAGHGGQEPDKAPLDEADGLDESFLLSSFNPDERHIGFRERIIDDTIHDWLSEANAKGIKVIFVADACHSGTMTRGGFDNRAPVTFRGRPPYGVPSTTSLAKLRENGALVAAAAVNRDDDLANVTFLSATQEDRKAPEVVIDGGKRGALSYAFSRALEGAADANGDGVLSRYELEAYIGRQVRQISEAQQAADLKPRGGQDLALLPIPGASTAGITGLEPGGAHLRVSMLGLTTDELRTMASRLSRVEVVASGAPADLVWDASARDVISGIGDPVAHDIGPAALQGVIDKWRTLAEIKHMLGERPADVKLDPDDDRHAAGSEVAIYTAPLTQPYVAVFDLAPDGTINLLYPLPNDPLRWPEGRPYRLDRVEVRPPFGADHVLLVASDKPLAPLVASLKTASVAEVPARLTAALQGADYRLGLLGLYTEPGRKTP